MEKKLLCASGDTKGRKLPCERCEQIHLPQQCFIWILPPQVKSLYFSEHTAWMLSVRELILSWLVLPTGFPVCAHCMASKCQEPAWPSCPLHVHSCLLLCRCLMISDLVTSGFGSEAGPAGGCGKRNRNGNNWDAPKQTLIMIKQ